MKKMVGLLGAIALVFLITFLLIPRIPQWSSYHHFADSHRILEIPNFWNVASNIPFFIISFLGFSALRQQRSKMLTKEIIIFFVIFTGIFFIGMGSAYYHWSPDNMRLAWDRMPITIIFMSLLSLTIMERINLNLGFYLLFPLITLGIISVLYWYWTERLGIGDLRLYGLAQFFPGVFIIMILYFYPKNFPPLNLYMGIFIFYTLAKVFELLDAVIYDITGMIGGHMWKHIFAAFSTYYFVIMVKRIDHKQKSNT